MGAWEGLSVPNGDAVTLIAIWLLCAIAGALVAPRNGWTPGVGAAIGGVFVLPGILFLLIVRASR